MASKRQVSKYGSVVILIFAAILLFFAQSAYWVNHTVFNKASFSHTATTALLSDSSRDAIATTIVNKSLENRPIIKKAIGKRAISLTSGLLSSDISTQVVQTLADKTYAYATTKDREDIQVDLSAIKAPLAAVITLVQRDDTTISSVADQIPDEITLVKSDDLPNLSGAVQTMLWLGPLLWLSSIGLFALYIYLGRASYARRVYAVGGAIIAVAIFGLLMDPFIPPPIAAAIPNIDLRPVAQNVAAAFLAPFTRQMYVMLGTTLLVLAVFNQRFNIYANIRKLESRLSPQPSKQAVTKTTKKSTTHKRKK